MMHDVSYKSVINNLADFSYSLYSIINGNKYIFMAYDVDLVKQLSARQIIFLHPGFFPFTTWMTKTQHLLKLLFKLETYKLYCDFSTAEVLQKFI